MEIIPRQREHHWMGRDSNPNYGYGGGGMSPRTDLKVTMCCAKCENKAQEGIEKLSGVQDVITDPTRSLVTVFGNANTHDLMKKAKKVDKNAALLATESYNNRGHSGYGGYGHSTKYKKPQSTSLISALFSPLSYKHNEYRHGHGRDLYHDSAPRYLSGPVEYSSSPQIHRDYHRSSGYNPGRAGSTTTFVPNDYYASSPQAYRDYNMRGSGYNDHDVMRDGRDYRDYNGRDQYSRGGDYYHQPGYGYERDDYRYSYNEYRPSQSYPSRYESEYQDSEVYATNPSYMKQIVCY
jgi:copper chaperone CopZ